MALSAESQVLSIFADETENPDYLKNQLITYIGNKRSLLPSINRIIGEIRDSLGGRRLRTADIFSGSGVVARLLKQHSSFIAVNDLESYARILSECFLANKSSVPVERVQETVNRLNTRFEQGDFRDGFIRRMYAPLDEEAITPEDRVFYSVDNARRLDSFIQWINEEEEELKPFLLGPLMSKASVHTNTAGVFKGFYKNSDTKKGQFGGKGQHALTRILGKIVLEVPALSNFETENLILQGDSTVLAADLPELDLVYLDPPYNQHPYGANYFMLDFLHNYEQPEDVSRVSGIPTTWNRSDFNVKNKALRSLEKTIDGLNSKFVLVSFNDEGFISPPEMRNLLNNRGELSEVSIEYNTYRASRNLKDRNEKVNEHLFLLKKG